MALKLGDGTWKRFLLAWRRMGSPEDFGSLARDDERWERRIRRAIESLAPGVSDRGALLMTARLTPKQISTITGVPSEEIRRRMHAAKEGVARSVLEDEHARRLAGSELTAYIGSVADRMTRRRSEEKPTPVEEGRRRLDWIGWLRRPVRIPAFVVAVVVPIMVLLVPVLGIWWPNLPGRLSSTDRNGTDGNSQYQGADRLDVAAAEVGAGGETTIVIAADGSLWIAARDGQARRMPIGPDRTADQEETMRMAAVVQQSVEEKSWNGNRANLPWR